ncbi:MAG: glycosyl hydrolase [Bacteroidales bacterium]|nr:glycosyl hydrolase [Bacteroidales bacterium]
MRYIYLLISCFVMFACSNPLEKNRGTADNSVTIQKLSDDFENPPVSSRPGAYWCWLNGDVTMASITRDLEEMKDKGLGRAEIWDVALRNDPEGEFGIGPEFLGDESVDYIKHTLSEGKRLGIKIGMVASSGWNAGGSWVTPEWATKALYSSERIISGPEFYSGPLPFPELPENCPRKDNGMPVFYKEIAVLAIPGHPNKKIYNLSEVVDLSTHFDGKILKWEVPEGKWTIQRFVCSNTGQHLIVPSPNSNGLMIDFFDPNATKKHLSYILNRLGITKENYQDSGLDYLEFDSMELDEGTPWTDAMDSIFSAQHNYDILPYLPLLHGWELTDGNSSFMYDFRKTVSDQIIFSHYTTGRNFLAEYGIDLIAEAGGPGPPIWNTCPVDALKALGNVSIPRGEFWIRHRNIFLIKEIASASHIYGLENVDAESFTTWRRWKDAPHAMKRYVDRAFCEGLNMITFHTFANTRPEHGLPGRAYHAGSDINFTTTWWEQAKPFMDYLSRCSYILKQGKFVGDVAYYYGDKAPNFFPEFHDVPEKPGLEGLSAGYDYDVVNTDVILHRMDVSEGNIILPDGMNYRLLVLPDIEDIPEHVVSKAERLIEAGANVLVQNPEIAKTMKGKVLKNMTIDDALASLSIDKDFIGNDDKLDFIHRKVGAKDIYFVHNKTDREISETCEFRVSNKQPELWDPVTARQYIIKNTSSHNGVTPVKLVLPAYGSCFIVFSEEKRELPEYNQSARIQSKEIQNPWTLSFPENRGAPSSVELDKLISWIDHEDKGINFFSGTATYTNSFNISTDAIDNEKSIYIDLGEVRDVAEVFVNDELVGVLWTKPFNLNIKDHVKEGENQIAIKVTNMWINRLTGDMDLPVEEKFCRTNRPYILEGSEMGDETFRLQDAGLLGPVTIQEDLN